MGESYMLCNMKQYLKYFAFLSVLALHCSDKAANPNNENVIISGQVTLQNQSDHSGVKISLYLPVELDTALARINNRYTNIGIKITQETSFDHRKSTPFKTTNSQADGTWKIDDVPPGMYNVVAEKEGFGFRVRYLETLTENITFSLLQTDSLSGVYLNDIIIPENGFAVINGNTVFEQNHNLKIGYGSILLFKQNSRVTIKGQLEFFGDQTKYINIIQENSIPTSRIRLDNLKNVTLSGLIIKDTENGFFINRCDTIQIRNCLFSKNNFGVDIFDSDKIEIQNCIFYNTRTAINADNSQCNISKNIIYGSEENGYNSLRDRETIITNNLFEKINNALPVNLNAGFGSATSTIVLYQNDFRGNQYHIRLASSGFITANNNNFLGSALYAVVAPPVPDRIYNFQNNFWQTNDITNIEAMILDKNDDPGLSRIDYTNLSNSYIQWP